MVDSRFYYEFEQRFRGTRDEVRGRLESYGPVLRIIENAGLPLDAVDCGCGRGEWLELLTKRGWSARGVDMNSNMLGPAAALGLSIEMGDAVAYVRGLPDESVSVVSGFHIAEHLPTDVLLELLTEAHRVLRPGGVVILETPNPENILVGSNRFYMDPTHLHPIPPNFLKFAGEYSGFEHAMVIGLNRPQFPQFSELAAALKECLELFPDYALVAQKAVGGSKAASLETVEKEHFANNSPYGYLAFDRLVALLHHKEANKPSEEGRSQPIVPVTPRKRDPISRTIREIRRFLRRFRKLG